MLVEVCTNVQDMSKVQSADYLEPALQVLCGIRLQNVLLLSSYWSHCCEKKGAARVEYLLPLIIPL